MMRRPTKRHLFMFVIVLCSILVPPVAVAIRFGIGTDFFINVVLTICGYIPGHVHNWFIQRVRNNNNRDRTPTWLKKTGLVVNPSNSVSNSDTGWAERYRDMRAPVQHDEEGRAYYENPETGEFDRSAPIRHRPRQTAVAEEDSDEEVGPSDGLAEPDRYINRPTKSVSSQPPMETQARPQKSLKSRTLKFFGANSGASSASGMDRHARIGSALDPERDPVLQRRQNMGYYDELDSELNALPSSSIPVRRSPSPPPAHAPTHTMDALDRELMGLSVQTEMPPVRTRNKPSAVLSRTRAAQRSSEEYTSHTDNHSDALERDIMDTHHEF
ncbi:hypothetical protein MVES1_002238 [Malassezia vespertilionis]|uniref:Uncharacterized protein n=1 Tax=Malassezia vespertilionis TaxID=2020962 RepID=A0A2N1JBY7_9BASI|nr:uncharacterized protein MVES1_002238 [Malassezia vespertilionis]PKI84056.1 hypothetical protein MVES_002112 [Malassezia vespertilionis]WFD06883.1 hypothetical protein MVES1_002238 [Malassezia vespertilionis]